MNPLVLRSRLRDVMGPAVPAGAAWLEAGREQPRPPRGSVPPLAEVLGGSWRETAGGRSFVVERRVLPSQWHGGHRIEEFAAPIHDASASAVLLGASAARAPFVFFDLETTGLSGGAGTYAFLVGCGLFEDDGAFLTQQHLMVDYAGEGSMLRVVADALGRAGALVTFNGKSFDAPVVETRYVMHRSQSPCAGLPHLDVLHPARRFWGGASDAGCSLTTLEELVLGARRKADVPGAEIPARYFEFIRSGDARPLAAVFEHNRLDLLSLAGLTARLFYLVEAGPARTRDAREALALGQVYGRAGLDGRAQDAFEHAVVSSGPAWEMSKVKVEALRVSALEARRIRHYDLAARRWRQLLEVRRCPAPVVREATEALAIHHEHRARDLGEARTLVLRSLELEGTSVRGDAVRHRLARIERKIVSERRPLFPSSSLRPSCGSPTSARRTSS